MYFDKLIAGFAREKQFKPGKCGRKLCSLHYNLKLINLDICHFQQGVKGADATRSEEYEPRRELAQAMATDRP